jgi:hypothetical protein
MKACVLSVVFFTLLLDLQGQVKKFPSDKSEKEKFEEAQKLFAESDYEKAFDYYDYLEQVNPGHVQVELPMALCVQHLQHDQKIVLPYFERIKDKDRVGNDFSFYYGLCLHKNYQFDEAIHQMNLFLKQGKFTPEQKRVAEKTIAYCENALLLAENKTGKNGAGDEFNSVSQENDMNYPAPLKTITNAAQTSRIEKSNPVIENPGVVREPYIYYISKKNLVAQIPEISCSARKQAVADYARMYADLFKREDSLNNSISANLKIMPLADFLDFNHPDLTFRIQVGSFCSPENLKSAKFDKEYKCIKETDEKGVVRYTIQDFKTLREAYAYRDEIIEKGKKDAFVTAMFKGKRILLVDVRTEIAKSLALEIN